MFTWLSPNAITIQHHTSTTDGPRGAHGGVGEEGLQLAAGVEEVVHEPQVVLCGFVWGGVMGKWEGWSAQVMLCGLGRCHVCGVGGLWVNE